MNHPIIKTRLTAIKDINQLMTIKNTTVYYNQCAIGKSRIRKMSLQRIIVGIQNKRFTFYKKNNGNKS